jgi:DNA repair exonuclease SbcCD nuclease subunit
MQKQEILDLLKSKESITIGMISDTHFAIYKSDNIFFIHLIDTIANFIELCEERKVDLVIHTGDVCDTKDVITTEGLFKTNEQLFRVAERFPVIMLPGNHDYCYAENNQISLPSNYKKHNNIFVVEEAEELVFPTTKVVFHFLPYYKNPIPLIDAIKIKKKYKNIFFGHLGIYGFKVHEYATNYANELASQITKDYFKKFDEVYLGHYHNYQHADNIAYVSAPLQSRHGDEQGKHGFIFKNTSEDDYEFVENNKSPQFQSVVLTKENLPEILKITNKYLRVYIKQKLNKETIIALRKRLTKNNYDVKLDIDIQDNKKLAVISGWKDFVLKDPDHLIIKYFDFLEEEGQLPYDKKELLKLLEIEKES